MINVNEINLVATLCIVIGCALVELLVALYMFLSLRGASKENAQLNKEMFGLLKKIEGLTATRREQMLRAYDQVLEQLANRLPPTIAAQAGTLIFETESKILTRLAELEPLIKKDDLSRRKMDELIKSMENLEKTIIVLTADTVRNVMMENRHSLFEDREYFDTTLAA